MPEDSQDNRLRHVLQELASGRLLLDEAYDEVNRLRPAAPARSPVVAKSKSVGGVMAAAFFFLLFGGIFGAVGGFFGYKTLRFELHGKTAEGVVVRTVHGGGKGKGSKPVVSYVVDGKKYEVVGSISSSPPAWKTGEKATVYYNPDDPSDAQISGFVERWLFPVIFGGIGAVTLLVGLGLLLGGIVRRLFRPLGDPALENARFSPE